MLKYFYMLVGRDDLCKPDRHLRNFVKKIFPNLSFNDDQIQDLLNNANKILKINYPKLTVRSLDNFIWKYQAS